jgi:hypothetical protein
MRGYRFSVSLPMMLESDNLPSKKKMKKTTTKKKEKIGVEASEQGISSAEGTQTTDRRFYFACLPQERKIQQQTSKQTNNINQSAAALYSTRKGKMSNVYLLVCPRLKEVCKTRIVIKFRARITYKVDKTELLFDHLLFLSVVFDRDLLPLVLSAAASSSLLSSAVLNAPWPACEMCVCACARVCLSLRLWFRQPSPLLFLISLSVVSQSASSC